MAVTSEAEFVAVVEKILSERPNNEASYADLIDEIPNRIALTADDLAPSQTRRNEPMWHQRVRNITSHKNFQDRLVSIPGGLKLAA